MLHREIIAENSAERERLRSLTTRLKLSELEAIQPNGWTVAVALTHMAFWDLRQVTLLNRWQQGVAPASLDAEAINGPLATLSATIPPAAAVRLALDAAEAADQAVEHLTESQAEELLKMGLERNLRRSLHRRGHLDRIEAFLKKG